MQFFFRTGENTGVGVGPVGLLILAPIYLAVIALAVAMFGVALLVMLVIAVGRAVAARRSGR